MRVQSAICAAVTTITKTIAVAAGVFAPGHLGELTRSCRSSWLMRCWRMPALPGGGCACFLRGRGVYFVLALGQFPQAGYLGAGQDAGLN